MSTTRLPTRRLFTPPVFSNLADEVDQLQASVRRMFDNPFLPMESSFVQSIGWVPAVEISETEKALVLTAELPGLDRKDVHVDLDGDVLTIRGEKKEEKKSEQEGKFHLMERTYGFFRRTFALPAFVDKEKISAEFAKGVLTLNLPKGADIRRNGKEIPIEMKG